MTAWRRGAPWSAAFLVLALLVTSSPASATLIDYAHTPPSGVTTAYGCLQTTNFYGGPGQAFDADDNTGEVSYSGGGAGSNLVGCWVQFGGGLAAQNLVITSYRLVLSGDSSPGALSDLALVCGPTSGMATTLVTISGSYFGKNTLTGGQAVNYAACSGSGGSFYVGVRGRQYQSGYGMRVWSVELFGEPVGQTPRPRIAAVYVCKAGTTTCDGTEAATSRGWSPASHEAVIRISLAAGSDATNCSIVQDNFSYADLTHNTFSFGSITNNTSVQLGITFYDAPSVGPAAPLHSGPHHFLCVIADSSASYPFVLNLDGSVTGATNASTPIVPGATYAPHNDVSDAPVSLVFDVFNDFFAAYQQKAPFVFIQPSFTYITKTISNLRAATMPAATNRYGSTTCPGYTMALPTPPVVRYPTATTNASSTATPVPTRTAIAWPSGVPLPSFTVLRCSDFEQIVSGWSWWHQARGLMDLLVYVGYGLSWLKRLQPRPTVGG